MKYLSVCSGIEAASVAWHPLGWSPVAFSEIDKFPSAVLAHHFPDVPNLGDMTNYADWNIPGSIDLVVGGTPCQAFSVSGRREGLNDERGNLALTFCEIADHFDPEWVLWENVPGVLSDKTNAFGCLLGRLCGASDALAPDRGRRWSGAGVVSGPRRTVAWSIRDAQYFGVAQCRRRVFVLAVRGAGNWRSAAALFPVGEGLRGDPAPGRKAGKGIAGTIDASAARSRGAGVIAGSLTKAMGRRAGMPNNGDTPGQLIVSHDPACTLTRREYKGPLPEADLSTVVAFDTTQVTSPGNVSNPRTGDPCHPLARAAHAPAIAFRHFTGPSVDALLGQGIRHDASPEKAHSGKVLSALRVKIGEEAFTQWGLGILDTLREEKVLRHFVLSKGERGAEKKGSEMVGSTQASKEDLPEGAMPEMRRSGRLGCASPKWGLERQLSGELESYMSLMSRNGASYENAVRDLWEASEGIGILRNALSEIQEVGRPFGCEGQSIRSAEVGHTIESGEDLHRPRMREEDARERILRSPCTEGQARHSYGVRRLTPIEAERLQGFPDNWTKIPYGKRGKPAKDGPRYAAIGNSMAVPVMHWIGRRIEFVNSNY